MHSASTELPATLIHIVDDDELVRRSLTRFLELRGYSVREYATGAEFLEASPTYACALLDLQLPDHSGLELQEVLLRQDDPLPVVFLTAHGQVPSSVEAMKAGAVDFLSKETAGEVLLEAIERAIARSAERWALRMRYRQLSPREREIFAHLISGQLNKQIAYDLGIAVQTTKVHRHRVLEKMRADSIIHLSRIGETLGIAPVGRVR